MAGEAKTQNHVAHGTAVRDSYSCVRQGAHVPFSTKRKCIHEAMRTTDFARLDRLVRVIILYSVWVLSVEKATRNKR
jgi:hypothetical protein